MAEGEKPLRARRRAPRPALREQVRAISRELKKKQQKRAEAARLAPEAAPRFAELAGGVKPLPRGALRATAKPPAPALHIVARQKTRLWVEESAGSVRARASGVPARWLDELESGRVVPRRELDLHRRSAADARLAITEAVSEARRAGVSCLLVVCGRGKHSRDGDAVLPDVTIECLSETLADVVLAFTSAPRKWGGKGAILVRLRPAKRRGRAAASKRE